MQRMTFSMIKPNQEILIYLYMNTYLAPEQISVTLTQHLIYYKQTSSVYFIIAKTVDKIFNVG